MENQIRNFVIISHIDHGKSTLADRFLELTGTIPKEKMKPQFLDSMDLEREKGITIKMQPCCMAYCDESGSEFILNLIDTPGHVDFSYEVSRSLAAVEGAIILVDATQGIQAQTISNLELAKAQDLVIIPVINKIDSPEARIEKTKEEIANLLNISHKEVLLISAKRGTNIKELLETVIKKIPPPETNQEKPLRALIFDSKYDAYKGIIAYVRIVDGKIKTGQNFYLMATQTPAEVKEVGVFKPELFPSKELKAGEIGYIATGIKEPEKIKIGDTIVSSDNHLEPLPGYLEPKPMVFASFYPTDPNDYQCLKEGLAKLKLNDASLFFEPETKEMLGRGFRCGFLGSLHAEIVSERLHRESGLDLIISTPSVVLKIINQKNQEILIYSPSDWPPASEIKEILEPWIELKIISPVNYLSSIFEILKNLKAKYIDTKSISKDRVILIEEIPLREIIIDFYDKLKTQTQGYGSMNYETIGYQRADLVKMEILINGKKEEAFSRIVARDKAAVEGKRIVEKLKKTLPFQLFSVPLQAVISGKIIARETLKAKRKDVIAPLYGGDYTRKRKLLEKQKKGKKKLKEKGGIQIPSKVFLEMFKRC